MAKREVKKSVILPILIIWFFLLTCVVGMLVVQQFEIIGMIGGICTILNNEVLSMGEKMDRIMPMIDKYERAMTSPDLESVQFGVGDARKEKAEDNIEPDNENK